MSTTTQTVSIQATPTGTQRTYAFSILIDGEALNETHDVLEANWTFGDGNDSELLEPTHTYATTGNYQVGVDVIFGDGKGDGDEEVSTPSNEDPPVESATTDIEVE